MKTPLNKRKIPLLAFLILSNLLSFNLFSHEMVPDPFPAPTLVLPANNADLPDDPVQFDWNNVNGAQRYRIQIATSTVGWNNTNGFQNVVFETVREGNATSWYTWNGAQPGQTYYWSVRAGSDQAGGYYAGYRTFEVVPDPFPAPTLVLPANNADLPDDPVQFDWNNVNGAQRYRIQIATSTVGWNNTNGFQNVVFETVREGNATSWYTWNGAQPGQTYYWSVRAGSDQAGGYYAGYRTFEVVPDPFPAPTLVLPANNADLPDDPVQFDWNNVNGAQRYRIQIATSTVGWNNIDGFQNVVFETVREGNATSWYTWNGAQPGQTYYWSVRAGSDQAGGYYAGYRTFEVVPDPFPAPTLVLPANNADLPDDPVQFDWNNVNGAQRYRIQIATSTVGWNNIDGFQNVVFETVREGNATSWYTWNGAQPGQTYYWSVRAGSDQAGGYYAGYRTFEVVPNPFPAPILVLPANNAVLPAGQVQFDWNNVTGATRYRVQIATSAVGWNNEDGFQNVLDTIVTIGNSNSAAVWNSAQPGQTYYWSVRAGSDQAGGLFASPRMFQITPNPFPAPILVLPANNAILPAGQVQFDWNNVTGATRYRVQIATSAVGWNNEDGFQNVLDTIVTIGNSNSSAVWNGAQPGQTYYWSVRAGSNDAGGLFASPRMFEIISGPYSADKEVTEEGDEGTWQDVQLVLHCTITGNNAEFVITKQDGSHFSSGGTMYLKVGTYEPFGVNHGSTTIAGGDNPPSFTFNDDLSQWPNNSYPKSYYARWQADGGGVEWVGPIIISYDNNFFNGPNLTYIYQNNYLGVDGTEVELSLRVVNDGNQSTGTLSQVGYYLSVDEIISANDYLIGTSPLPDLPAMGHSDKNINIDIPAVNPGIPEGWYYVGYLIDHNASVAEKNENDNRWTDKSQQVFVPATPTVSLIQPHNGAFQTGDIVNIQWTSTNQHHAGIYLYKGGIEDEHQVGTIELSDLPHDAQSFQWEIPVTIFHENNGVPHHINGNDYKIKIVVWSGATKETSIAVGKYSTDWITITPAPLNCEYTDIGDVEWAHDAITYLCNQGLLDDDGTVEPTQQINRGTLAKLTYLSIGMDETNSYAMHFPSPFRDLLEPEPDNIWYYAYAKNLCYLQYDDCKTPFTRDKFNFYPADPITRAHVVKALLEAWNIQIITGGVTGFNDVPDDHEMYDYIYTAEQIGMIQGDGGNGFTFRPNDMALRAEVFVMLHNIMEVHPQQQPNITADDFFKPLNYTYKNSARSFSFADGNFSHYGQTSFVIPGFNLPLVFAHSYNSVLIELPDTLFAIKPLGYGWNHNYNAFIVTIEGGWDNTTKDDLLVVVWPDRGRHFYGDNGNISYTEGVYDEFVKISATKYEITTKDQLVHTFEKLGASDDSPAVLTSIKDRNNNTISLSYENANKAGWKRLSQVTGTNNRTITIQYQNNSDLIASVTDPIGRVIGFEYTYNEKGEEPDLTKFTDAKQHITRFEYNTNDCGKEHLLQVVTLPKGNKISNVYDSNRKLVSSKEIAIGGSIEKENSLSHAYNYYTPDDIENFTETVVVDQDGLNSTINRNRHGGVSSASTPSGSIAVTYNPQNPTLPASVTKLENNVTVNYEYDDKGNVLQISLPGIAHHFSYTPLNDVAIYTDPRGNTVTYQYTNGNLTSVDIPGRGTTTIGRTPQGLIDNITSAENVFVDYKYDMHGNRVEIIEPLGITSKATFDDIGRMLTEINPNMHIGQLSWDANDNLLSDTNPLGDNTQYAYDPNGNLASVTNALNDATTLTYNNRDLLQAVTFGGNSTTYTYTDAGRVDTETTPDGHAFHYQYDNKGRPTNDGYAGYAYNSDNMLETVTKNGEPEKIEYSYDLLNRVRSITYDNQTVEYWYDASGNLTKIRYPGDKEVDYTWYEDNLLHTVTDWNNQITTYTYRNDGKPEGITYPNGITTTYSYDAAGRLDEIFTKTSANETIAHYEFTLDALGNITAENFEGVPDDAALPYVPNANYEYTHNRLNSAGDINQFDFDNNGNMEEKAADTYSFDVADQLTAATINNNTFAFTYDGLGNRRTRTKNGTLTKYALDILGMSRVLTETDANDNVQHYYIYGLGLLARIDANNQTRYYHYDYRGSTIAMTDENEDITHQYAYNDFGLVTQAVEEDENPFRYVGQHGVMYEDATLYYMRARYYDPTLGRFLSEDPIWSTNLYPYADNNPINIFDPDGMKGKGILSTLFNVAKSVTSTTGAIFKKVVRPILWVKKALDFTYHMDNAYAFSFTVEERNENKSQAYASLISGITGAPCKYAPNSSACELIKKTGGDLGQEHMTEFFNNYMVTPFHNNVRTPINNYGSQKTHDLEREIIWRTAGFDINNPLGTLYPR